MSNEKITTEELVLYMGLAVAEQGLTPRDRDLVYASICAAITYAQLQHAANGPLPFDETYDFRTQMKNGE